LAKIKSEKKRGREAEGRAVVFQESQGKIHADLRIGADVLSASPLKSNSGLVTPGVIPHGGGMVLDSATAKRLNPYGHLPNELLRSYCNGKELIAGQMNRFVIDAFPMQEAELKSVAPSIYQWLSDTVRPYRETTRDDDLREKWWLHRRNNLDLRNAQRGLDRFIGTVLTSKHRFFTFIPSNVLPDQTIVAVALQSAQHLSILSSRHHVTWSLAAGGWMGVGNDPRYIKSRCFDPFPFPEITSASATQLAELGEELDELRKRQQAAYPKLTLTQMYNVLEKLRAGVTIEGKDKQVYEQGLIGILKDLHDQIDAAVAVL
jgi:hypothetical protein